MQALKILAKSFDHLAILRDVVVIFKRSCSNGKNIPIKHSEEFRLVRFTVGN